MAGPVPGTFSTENIAKALCVALEISDARKAFRPDQAVMFYEFIQGGQPMEGPPKGTTALPLLGTFPPEHRAQEQAGDFWHKIREFFCRSPACAVVVGMGRAATGGEREGRQGRGDPFIAESFSA